LIQVDLTLSIENCDFIYYLGSTDANFTEFDIQGHENYEIHISNCRKTAASPSSKGIIESTGILVSDKNGVSIDDFNNYSNILSIDGTIYRNNRVELAFKHVDCNKNALTTLSGSTGTNGNVVWDKATATYYYQAQYLYDINRVVGTDNTNAEVSASLTNGGNGMLFSVESGNRPENCMLRLYRGTTTGSYDEYVDVPLVNAKHIYDKGTNIAGYAWKSRTAGIMDASADIQEIQIDHKRFVGYSDTIPSGLSGGTFTRGDRVYRLSPSASGTMGWVCTSSGSPGTWKTFGAISA